jgi:hypothetical protein
VARDNGPPGVEFVVDTGGDSPDEELPQSVPRRPNTRWSLIGAAVVLGGAALIARGVSHGDEPGSPSASSSLPSGSAGSDGAAIIAPESNRPLPDPRRLRYGAALCQLPASCSLTGTLPTGTIDALHETFPDITLRSAATVLSTRADKMAPDVVNRTIHASAGTAAVTIRIRTSVPIDSPDVEQHRGATSTTKVTAVALGYDIAIEVSRPGEPVPVATVQRLATDGRLILPVQ